MIELPENKTKIWAVRDNTYTFIVFLGAIIAVCLMYYRAFFGAELTDEAYHVAEAKVVLDGNIPYAYNYSSKAVGFVFIPVLLEAIYKCFVPSLEGIFLFTRLCFVTYKVMAAFIAYRVFQRNLRKSYAIILASIILALSASIANFDYNTIPIVALFIVGCILFDVIEQDAPGKVLKLVLAGIMTSLACFSNPGYTSSLIVFVIIILFRSEVKHNKKRDLFVYLAAVFGVVFLVAVLISIRTSFSSFCYGLYRLFMHTIPMDALDQNKTWGSVVDSFKGPLIAWIGIFAPVSALSFVISHRYTSESGVKLKRKQCFMISAIFAMCIYTIYFAVDNRDSGQWGFSIFLFMMVLFCIRAFSDEKIVLYLGVCFPLYTISTIILLSYSANINRFSSCFLIIVPILYVFYKDEMVLIRVMATVIAVVFILGTGYESFKTVYRDDDFQNLTHRIESGEYKGIYTTETRSKDLPELEEYLNLVIKEDETYAFRDNVPSAYLMVHTGKMCEISTWDVLQHSYHRNSPAVLFDYYRVRDMIPDIIVYIDYGRDENLSNIEPEYRYNDWINAYYELVDDFTLNDTFFHVIVYKYNGTFDGDYQWWIDNYWN